MTSIRLMFLAGLGLLIADVAWAQDKAPMPAGKMSAAQLLVAADAGRTDAQYAAAALILMGGMPATANRALRDRGEADALAIEYLRAASAQGHAPAQHLLGTLYLTGRGVGADPAKAKDLFLSAVSSGNTDAQNALGQMLRKGLGGTRDDKAAVAWFEKAAAGGNMLALTNLAYMHGAGLGVPKNEAKALELTMRAANAQIPEAQHNLGVMYYEGKGTAKSTPDAVAWYRRAAEQGYSPSALNVGFIYAKGEVGGEVREQLVEAVKWFALAATSAEDRVRETARKALSYVAERAPPDVMLDGSDAAQKWSLRRQVSANAAVQ